MARSKRPKAGKGQEKRIKPVATPEREEVTRRRFLRQSAEIAALSLFGTLGLDAVVQRVAERIDTMRGIDGMADRIVSGTGTAYASEDPVGNMLSPTVEGDSCPSG